VLAADASFDHIDPRHWHNGLRLLVPPRALASRQLAVAIVERPEPDAPPRAVAALTLGPGARPIDLVTAPLAEVSAAGLGRWARRLGLGAAVAIDSTLLPTLSAEVEPRLRLGDDVARHGLTLWRALRPRVGHEVWTYPDVLSLLPDVPGDALHRTIDRLIPDDSAVVAYVVDDDRRELHASIIAHRRGGEFVRITTHAAVADLVDGTALARDWSRHRPDLVRAITERVARPSVLVITTPTTLREVITGPGDQLARDLRAQRVIIDPAPAWLYGLLGGAAVAAVAQRGATALASLLPTAVRDRAKQLTDRARDAARDAGADPWALLGFDPLALWAQLRHLYRP
jgi:hypothetical protein